MAKRDAAHNAAVLSKNEIRMRDVIPCLESCYESRGLERADGSDSGPLAAMLWGPPGVAKSALAQLFAKQKGMPFVDIRLPLYDPVDLKGMPSVGRVNVTIVKSDGTVGTEEVDATTFISPQFLPRDPYIMLFEEIANAHEATMVTAQRIVLDRNLDNGWRAHPDTMMVCCSNRQSDACGANALLQALDNRLIHFEVAPDVDFWMDWLIDTYSVNEWGQKAVALIASFLSYRKELAYKFDPESTFKDQHGWPSFRTWEMGARLLMHAFKSKKKIRDIDVYAPLMGAIGVGAGFDFLAFVDLQDKLPPIKEIMEGNKFEIPHGQPDLLAALVGAIASNCAPKYHDRVWQLVDKIEQSGSPDWAVLLVRLAIKFDPSIGWKNGDKTSKSYTAGARNFCMRHKSEAITIFKQND